jgi:hypothetical protein
VDKIAIRINDGHKPQTAQGKDNLMRTTDPQPGEEFVRLALAIEQHMPGYVDSYFGPDEWMAQAKQAGKVPLPELTERADRLATGLWRHS